MADENIEVKSKKLRKIDQYLEKNDDLEIQDILHNKMRLFLFKFAESFNTGAKQATMRLSDHSSFQIGWEFETLTMLYIQPHFLLENLIDNDYNLKEFTFFDTFVFNPKKERFGISSHELDPFLEGKPLERLIKQLYGGIDIFIEHKKKANYRITDVIAYFIENFGFFFTECKASQDSLSVYLEDVIVDLFSNIYPAIYRALAKENIHVEDAFNKMVVSIKKKDRGALWRFIKRIPQIH